MGELDLEAEIIREQRYFDGADSVRRAELDYWREAAKMNKEDGDLAASKRASDRAQAIVGQLKEAVAFAKTVGVEGEDRYIGYVPVRDGNEDPIVHSWKSAAGVAYYQATPERPHGLAFKRSFTAEENRIASFADTLIFGLDSSGSGFHNGVSDELLASLSRARTGEMGDIVRTIQAEQDRIIRSDKDQLLIVQGGPGTGKTAIGLHRISWLLYTYDALRPSDVLVLGPNPTFVNYIKAVLPGLGDEGVVQRSVQDLLRRDVALQGHDSDAAARVKGSARMADVLAAALDAKIQTPTSPLAIEAEGTSVRVEVDADDVAAEIRKLRVQPYNVGRETLASRITELAVRQLQRLRPFGVPPVKSATVRQHVDKLWPSTSRERALNELFGDRRQLAAAGRGILSVEEVEALYREANRHLPKVLWTADDLPLLDELGELLGEEANDYAHILVDEAQDLSDMQLRAVRRRSRHGSMTIIGDIAQSTGPHARDSWEGIIQQLRSRFKFNVEQLCEGYRVPAEVFEIARPVLRLAAPAVTPPDVVREVGEVPEFHRAVADLGDKVAEVAGRRGGEGRFVGIVADVSHWPNIRSGLRSRDLNWSESGESGNLGAELNLISPIAAKGLEFDAVIVVDPEQILSLDYGSRLLYIALTRTTTTLDIVYPAGSLPEVLGGPDPAELESADVPSPEERTPVARLGTSEQDEAALRLVTPEGNEISFPAPSVGQDSLSCALDGSLAASIAGALAAYLHGRVDRSLHPAILEHLERALR